MSEQSKEWHDARQPEQRQQSVGFCPDCLNFGIRISVEKWKTTPMRYCTFHYWLMKGREKYSWMGEEKDGYTLEVYVERSKHFGFVTSLPSSEQMAKMLGEEVHSVFVHSSHL